MVVVCLAGKAVEVCLAGKAVENALICPKSASDHHSKRLLFEAASYCFFSQRTNFRVAHLRRKVFEKKFALFDSC